MDLQHFLLIAVSVAVASTLPSNMRQTVRRGVEGKHYNTRAGIAWVGLGANQPDDTIYVTAFNDNRVYRECGGDYLG